jgi:hypothetical protein
VKNRKFSLIAFKHFEIEGFLFAFEVAGRAIFAQPIEVFLSFSLPRQGLFSDIYNFSLFSTRSSGK